MQDKSLPSPVSILRAASMVLFAGAMAVTSIAFAQSVRDFSLPSGEETPSTAPSQAPQGPVDERAGVEIAPRSIEPEAARSNTPTAPQPEASPTGASPQPVVQELPPQAAPENDAATPQSAARPSIATVPLPSQTVAPETIPSTQESAPDETIAGPSFDTDILPTGAVTQGTSNSENVSTGQSSETHWTGTLANYQTFLIIASALMIALLIVAFLRKSRKTENAASTVATAEENSSTQSNRANLTSTGASKPRVPTAPATAPVPTPIPASTQTDVEPVSRAAPTLLDTSIEIVGASRSLMMFTLDLRILVTNRSDTAIRDLQVSGELAFAQAGSTGGAPNGTGEHLGVIERVGPRQSQTLATQIALPLSELKTIRQGAKPLFIPLVHLTIAASETDTQSRSFVVGSPSATSAGRVHPLTLDGPPGGIQGLRAQEIRNQSAAA